VKTHLRTGLPDHMSITRGKSDNHAEGTTSERQNHDPTPTGHVLSVRSQRVGSTASRLLSHRIFLQAIYYRNPVTRRNIRSRIFFCTATISSSVPSFWFSSRAAFVTYQQRVPRGRMDWVASSSCAFQSARRKPSLTARAQAMRTQIARLPTSFGIFEALFEARYRVLDSGTSPSK